MNADTQKYYGSIQTPVQGKNLKQRSWTLFLYPSNAEVSFSCEFSCTPVNAFLLHISSKTVKIAEHVRKQEIISMSLLVKGGWVSWLTAILTGKTSTDTALSLHSMRLLCNTWVSWGTFIILLHIPPWIVLLFLISDKRLQDLENMFPAFSSRVCVAHNDHHLLQGSLGHLLVHLKYWIQAQYLTLLFMVCSHTHLTNLQSNKGSRTYFQEKSLPRV